MLHLAGPDPEGQRAKRAVSGRMGVAAHDRHPGLGDAQLGANHVHDALMLGPDRVHGNLELCAVALQRFDLNA